MRQMRKFSVVALSTTAALAFASRASADLLYYDSFNYPDQAAANLSTTPNYSHSGGATEPQPESVGGLKYPGLGTSDDSFVAEYNGNASGVSAHEFSTGITTGAVYFSLLMKVPTVETSGGNGYTTNLTNLTNGSFMAGLDTSPQSTAPGANNTAVALLIRSGDGSQTSDTYQLGVENTATAGDRTWYGDQSNTNSSTNFTTGDNAQTVFVVLKYTFDAFNGDSVGLFVNPTVTDTEPAPTLTAPVDTTNFTLNSGIRSVYLRNNSVEPDVMYVDELRVGTTWVDVIPEPASMGLFALGGIGLIGRRRRAVRAL
jgi:hypothetical protein